ncbi:SH3 and multiple ankyrin repeat domains protein 1 isoform X1 [Formica exsecta]|uniref:SH3 and multiple ankyrin repeat domains protein 1 isoform X1 n=1 Tax=Formica exsecta TaxID=72781 RepID=UPI00114288B2|nr:SH3 and multiple ankyrin repeat domains protein 1 isoform X1 [Formica exsecta]XP_029680564.1 SH3 and multiple ankyrin repeat domains protein 1 isoform X1 [Formica exsecta]XP_029680565.1 SH3 and multiple ankyrin repeat domains protein 1 isoform X1 [Formica exsecta]
MEAGPKQQQPPQQQQPQQQSPQQQQQQNSPGNATQAIIGPQGGSTPQAQQNAEDALAAAENTPVNEGMLLARIHVPELYVSKCLQFPKDQLVWDVKQQCLASLPKVATWYRELKESFNYGLFCPPVNGKAGKFLDEERRLGDYPFNGPVGYLELKYKRRVYKMLHLDEKQLKAMHTRTNLRRLLDYVQSSQVEKIAKMCSKGLDPNFHCQETGETPLTLATTLKKPSKVIIALVNGGALLDYRTKEGLTAMHRAVERNSLEAVKTLLELGASPNYKDTKGLTPLYYSVIHKTDPMLCETLLHDHATIGAQDLQGWQEVHQACRNNLVQHLDHLLFYGADMNARNASGNTPLHVCAVNNTDASCIRQLLFRGAQKDALNYANQTPYQVAVIAGNMELAEVIKNYQPEEVVPFKGPPRYNPKRRSVAFGGTSTMMTTSCSASNLGTLTRIPSTEQHAAAASSAGGGTSSGTLTRTISVEQYSSITRVPSAEQYATAASLNRVPSTEQPYSPPPPSSGTLVRVASEEKYAPSGIVLSRASSGERYDATLIRVPSSEQYPTVSTLTRVPSTEQYPTVAASMSRVPSTEQYPSTGGIAIIGQSTESVHHGSLGRVPSVESSRNDLPNRIPSEQNGHRLTSEYQSPNSLRDPNARLPSAAENYTNLRMEGLTRLQEHRLELQHRLDMHRTQMEMPPSPSPSSRSLAPFSSASSSLSEGSNQPSGEDSASIVTDKSLGDTASDVISDSSGVGTSQSDTTNSLSIPGTTVVCVESYNSGITGHLTINQGDILEVTGATDCGLLEGVLRGQGTGLFPAHCVQEVRLRHTNIPLGPQPARDGRNRVLGRRESQHKYFATAPRLKKPVTSEPRTVVLHRSRKGFGFVLRGAKATSPLMELTPSARYPALQYLDDVDQGGVADLAGLRKGDFLIQINGEDVTTASHEHVVDLIRKSGELVRMTVISPVISLPNSQSAAALPTSQPIQRQYATLPRKGNNNVVIGGTLGRSPAPVPPRRDPKTTLSVGRARARSMVAGLEGGGERDDRDEIASTGAKSSSAESIHMPQQPSTGSNTGQNTPVQPRTASIRSRPTSSRITAAELEELFQRQQGSAGGQYSSSMMSSSHFQTTGQSTKSHPSSPAKTGRVYASVAEMKRKGKSQSKVRFFGGLGGGSDLHRDFHSTPDLNVQAQSSSLLAPKCHRSQEDVNALNGRNGLPPPNHPPPPPPVGQVIKMNVGANVPDVVTPASVYDNMAHIQQVKELAAATVEGGYGVMSSFRPSNSAKLYASPEDMKTVGYRSRSLPANRPHLRKSHSLRNPPNNTMFKPTGSQQALNNNVGNMNSNGNGNNQYAQPLKTTRSHSTAGIRERKKKTIVLNASSSVTNLSSIASGANGTTVPPNSAPPIPEPDYSLSESENDDDEGEDDETDEDGESEIAKELEKAAAREKLEATRETSGNSNTSGSSSSGSGSLPHSFSVEEIQKVRTQLKSSKSHPNDFLLQTQQSLVEDGDNSSSGVSSDQDVPVGPPMGFDDTAVRNLANQESNQHSGGAALLTSGVNPIDKENNQIKRPGYGGSGLLTRHAVSLAQLPPPIEADAEEQNNDLFVPPPPEFNAGPSAGGQDQEVVVFAPPPQFCDNKHQQQQQQQQQTTSQNRVKIIGAIPKVAGNQVKASGGRALP